MNMRKHLRDASAPPSALIERLMRVFCVSYLRRCVIVFNRLISRLASDRLAALAKCPMKRYVFAFIYTYIVSYESNEHF